MYIPTWLAIIIIIVVLFWILKSKSSGRTINNQVNSATSVEDIENGIPHLKESIFSLEHFDSPQFIDVQDTFDVMEGNYIRLKQRLSHDQQEVLEIAKDWQTYVLSLIDLKSARVMLDVDMDVGAGDRPGEKMKEPSIIKDEIEKTFKSLLGKEWQDIPPDYLKKIETMKEPNKEARARYEIGDDWKYYYQNSTNLMKLEDKRQKVKEGDANR